MPGLYAVMTAGRRLDQPDLPVATTWPRYRARLLSCGDHHLIGAYLRHRGPDFLSQHEHEERFLTLYGHCADARLGRFLSAADLAQILARDGDAALDHLEGAFSVLEVDHNRKQVRLFNDRIGILAVYWHHHDGMFAVAPRLGLLPRSARDAGLNPGAVITFLSVGHFLGPNTQWKAANYLTPATIVTFDQRTGEVSQRRYWNLVYEPDNHSSTGELCRRLGEAIQESSNLLAGPPQEKGGIFLSGGWDSRSLLGASLAGGRPPQLVVTNGMSDEIPGADTFLARKMARDLGLPYKFCRRDPEIGPAAWADGLRKGEITTANNPENFGQHDLPPDFFEDMAYMLKGDVTWGSGAPATSREMAIAKVVPFPLSDNVKAVLAPDVARQADELYMEQIDSVMRHCQNDGWTERRDYLWQMGGINRYILGLGISDEEHVQVRRPLLSGIVLRHYTTVPRHLRCHKNLFVESIRRFYPELFAYRRNHVSNIAQYYHYMAPYLRKTALSRLEATSNSDGIIDSLSSINAIAEFRPGLSVPAQPNVRMRLRNLLHDRFSYLLYRNTNYRERNSKRFRTSDNMLSFHIYCILEYLAS